METETTAEPFWSRPAQDVLAALDTSEKGLGSPAARERLKRDGANSVVEEEHLTALRLLLRQFESPLVLILIFGACISLFLHEWTDAAIILIIVFGSIALGFYQEYRASKAVQALRNQLALTTRAMRDGTLSAVPASTLVRGDIILLTAGNLVPADALILESKDFLVNEASLTGESFPVEKQPGVLPAATPVSRRTNMIFMGSSARSGTARAVIVETGKKTAFSAIAARLKTRPPETEFARGVRQFGAMLVRIMMGIVLFVLLINGLLGRPIADSLLFAVALAIGISPELLPAIVSVTLSAGARHLAKEGVIVRRLEAIENLGSIDILCTDKTGTLTEGETEFHDAIDVDGKSDPDVRQAAFLNAALETGIENPLDAAIVAMGKAKGLSADGLRKIDEIPYDFVRRRLTIVIEGPDPATHRILCKGAFVEILAVCNSVRVGNAQAPIDAAQRQRLGDIFRTQSESGFRVLAMAERSMPAKASYGVADEQGFTFTGFLLFDDPPKPEAAGIIRNLQALGIATKIISGDNRYVTGYIAKAVGLDPQSLLTGEAMAAMDDESLWAVAPRTDLFVEIDPQQKERIVRALQHSGHAVGYMGDGINDVPPLHAADVGISVSQAVDVARETADVVLLRRDLDVLRQGVEDGRKTFANTLKYISITVSANFGNMISMALATPLLPFLPLLPKQILLNNFLADFPSVAISTDNVDPDHISQVQRWNVGDVRRFMVVFGLISSCFDFLTFGVVFFVFHATEEVFHTSWFVVSLLTELLVFFVLRTRLPIWRSRPGRLLIWSAGATAILALATPYLGRLSAVFGFVPLTGWQWGGMVAIAALYVVTTEAAKHLFYRYAARGGLRKSKPAPAR